MKIKVTQAVGKTVTTKPIVEGTGVPVGTTCKRCGITAEESAKLPPVETGIDHPVYCQTKSFYHYNDGKHMCPRCHRETQLESLFEAMDNYEQRTGKKLMPES